MGKKISPTGIAVLIFAIVLITMTFIRSTSLGSDFSNPVGSALNRLLQPIERGIWTLGDEMGENIRAIFRFRAVEAENEALRQQVEQLTGDNLQLKQQILAGLRYQELDEKIFQSPTLEKYEKIGATIVNRNPTAWYRTITVNKGSNHGVKLNDSAVGKTGLVGKVISVSATTADILLILDGEGQVGATVRDSKGNAIFGILVGTYKRSDRLTASGGLEMNVRHDDEVNTGDLVFTSGLGGVYPKDVPIGVVTELTIDATGLLKTAAVHPIVDFDALEEVYLIRMPEGRG